MFDNYVFPDVWPRVNIAPSDWHPSAGSRVVARTVGVRFTQSSALCLFLQSIPALSFRCKAGRKHCRPSTLLGLSSGLNQTLDQALLSCGMCFMSSRVTAGRTVGGTPF